VTFPFFQSIYNLHSNHGNPETNQHQRCHESPSVGLGDRVRNWVTSVVNNRKETLGADKITHDIRIVE
jgi:hypothetical protein